MEILDWPSGSSAPGPMSRSYRPEGVTTSSVFRAWLLVVRPSTTSPKFNVSDSCYLQKTETYLEGNTQTSKYLHPLYIYPYLTLNMNMNKVTLVKSNINGID